MPACLCRRPADAGCRGTSFASAHCVPSHNLPRHRCAITCILRAPPSPRGRGGPRPRPPGHPAIAASRSHGLTASSAPEDPPRVRLLHGLQDFPIRRRRNFLIRCRYGSKVWTHIYVYPPFSCIWVQGLDPYTHQSQRHFLWKQRLFWQTFPRTIEER